MEELTKLFDAIRESIKSVHDGSMKNDEALFKLIDTLIDRHLALEQRCQVLEKRITFLEQISPEAQ